MLAFFLKKILNFFVEVLCEGFYYSGIIGGGCFPSSFLLFRTMCVRYRIGICEKVSITL